MEETIDDNKITENNNDLEHEHKFSFISKPWDDRSRTSKLGIIVLLITIFVATIACMINNFVTHYKNFNFTMKNTEINCYRMKLKEFPFVARIHLLSSNELLCVGAVVSPFVVLASGICVRDEPLLVYIGDPTDSRCKRGFILKIADYIEHDGIVSKRRIVLLSSTEDLSRCTVAIRIGSTLDWNSKVDIIGRSSIGLQVGWSLTRQHVSLSNETSKSLYKNFCNKLMFCAKGLARCPVKAGDLLTQRGFLYGVAAATLQFNRQETACFANLTAVKKELMSRGIDFERSSR